MTRDQSAFTVFELLSCIALLGVVLAIAVPNMTSFIQHQRDTTLRNQLIALLHSARAQAIMHKQRRAVCGSNNGLTCTGHWDQNWLLIDKDNALIQHIQVPANSAICWAGFSSAIAYKTNGTTPTSNGRFSLCRQGAHSWSVILNRQGRLRIDSSESASGCC